MSTVAANGTNGQANGHANGATPTSANTIGVLVDFVTRAVERHGEQVTRFELRQMEAGGGASRVSQWPRDPNVTARAIAAEAYELARSEARGLGGTVQYYLAYYIAGDDAHVERRAFRITAPPMDGSHPSEGAGFTGLQIQGMRHQEAIHHAYMMGVADNADCLRHTIHGQQRHIDDLLKTIERMRTREDEHLDARRDLVLQTHQRDLEMKREDASIRRKDAVLAQIASSAIPILVRKLGNFLGEDAPAIGLTGGAAQGSSPPAAGAAPQSREETITPAQTRAVLEFLQSLDEETFVRVFAILKPDQQQALSNLAAIFSEATKKPAQQQQQQPETAPDDGSGIGVRSVPEGGSS